MPAHALFFPAAALYGAVALPAFVATFLGAIPAIPGLATGARHAHEMVFGFALAVVAGNQLGPTPARWLGALFAAWIAARVAFLAAPLSAAALAANAAFAVLLGWQLVPRLFGRAKKLRNRALPFNLALLCALALAIPLALRWGTPGFARQVHLAAVLALAMLMLFMGGRIIAPAAAEQLQRQGQNLDARVQPRIEGALIVAMLLALAAIAAGMHVIAGLAALGASAIAFARLARWRLWALRGRPDLLCLGAGYAWVAIGLAALGAAIAWQGQVTTALHVVTVGAVGTLTVNVMALTWARLARRDPARERLPVASTALLAVATMARLWVDLGPGDPRMALAVAAACWSAAFVLLLALFARRG